MEALFPTTFRLPSESRTPTKGGRFSSSSSSQMASPRFSPSYGPSSPSRPPTARSTSEDYFSSGSSTHGSSEGSSSRKRTELPCTYEIWVDTAPTGQTHHTSFKSFSPSSAVLCSHYEHMFSTSVTVLFDTTLVPRDPDRMARGYK